MFELNQLTHELLRVEERYLPLKQQYLVTRASEDLLAMRQAQAALDAAGDKLLAFLRDNAHSESLLIAYASIEETCRQRLDEYLLDSGVADCLHVDDLDTLEQRISAWSRATEMLSAAGNIACLIAENEEFGLDSLERMRPFRNQHFMDTLDLIKALPGDVRVAVLGAKRYLAMLERQREALLLEAVERFERAGELQQVFDSLYDHERTLLTRLLGPAAQTESSSLPRRPRVATAIQG